MSRRRCCCTGAAIKPTICGQPVGAGYQIDVYDNSGATLLGSGVTDSAGVWVFATAISTFRRITVTPPSGSAAVATTATVLTTVGGTTTVALSLASGHACGCGPCSVLPTTLNASIDWIGSVTLTYSSGSWSSGRFSVVYPGCGDCPGGYAVGLIVKLSCTLPAPGQSPYFLEIAVCGGAPWGGCPLEDFGGGCYGHTTFPLNASCDGSIVLTGTSPPGTNTNLICNPESVIITA